MSCEVTLTGVRTRLGRRIILENLDLVAPAGKVTVVMGESGSGKTTLLRVIAGLQALEGGSVRFDGEVVTHLPAHRRGVALAFQNYALYPGQSVARNLELPLLAQLTNGSENCRLWRRSLGERLRCWPALGRHVRNRTPDRIETRVGEMLDRLGIRDLAQRPVERLSGGEQQRVALGRALIRRPRVLLLDEPLSNVDPARQQEIVDLFHELVERDRPTTLLVTHDWHEAILLGHWIAILQGGRILQHGPPNEIYENPRDLRVLAFSQQGGLNRLPNLRPGPRGRLLSADGRIAAEPNEPLAGDCYTVVFRSEHLRPCGPAAGWGARVRSAQPAAGNLFLELEAAGRRWFAAVDLGTAEVGRQLRVELVPGRGWVADASDRFVARLCGLEVRS